MTRADVTEETEPFRITSLEDAESLATCISRYGEATIPGYNVCDHFRNAYNYSRIHCDDVRINGKLLNAYIDLELTYLFMMKDVHLAGGMNNQLQSRGKIASGSVLEDFELFSGKADILYALSALSFRVRAYWDKLMGILFLLYEYERYEEFIGARSRKAYFFKNAQDWSEISLHFRKCLTNTVRTWLIHSEQREAASEIDNLNWIVPFPDPFLKIMGDVIGMVDYIRTPEAHGAGFLRKWTLANFPIDKSRDFSLINHWNIANEFLHALRATIYECLTQRSSPH